MPNAQPLQVLKEYWGYDNFRPLQEDIIQSVLDGKDTLALLPTGGGKSICFQVPALAKDGICLVISPLIALMKDQVYNLQKRGINAVAIYSGMHYKDIDRTFDNCIYGDVKFLYLSPERLTTDLARERISQMNINLIAVDEAHCISQWGYDFRPPYLEIANIRTLKPQTPVLALTATATPKVVEDIQDRLAFKTKNILQKSFARDNLSYVVLHEFGKLEKLLDIVRKVPGAAVIYTRNRRKTKEIAKFLIRRKISADFYHAGLSNEVRSQKQDAWIQNKTRIIVATNAFGMGIDKPDVRLVVHVDVPDSLEAYFQEAGRGGRDGKKSYAVLLYNENDRQSLRQQYRLTFPDWKLIKQVYQALGSYYQLATGSPAGESYDFDIIDFTTTYNLNILTTFNCLKILDKEGWLTLTEAVYIPSKLWVKVSKDALYDYQIKHRGTEKLLKTILRTYQGAFNHHVAINEYQLSKFLSIGSDALEKSLLMLHADGIVDYIPQRNKPQIIFTQERVAASNLTYDKAKFDFLKKRYAQSIKACIDYATLELCRSQQLLAYFGETNPPTCGKCDVCLQRNKTVVTESDFKSIKNSIKNILKEENMTLKNLLDHYKPQQKNQVLKVLQHLLDHKEVTRQGDVLKNS